MPGTALGDHLQVLHHDLTGLLGVQLVALDQIDRRRVRAHVLVPIETGKASDPDARHHLAARLARVRRFEHPNNLRILGFLSRHLTRTASFVIVTERPSGHSLRRILQMRGALDAKLAGALIDRVAAFLEAAHEADLLHLALTPDAILVDPDHMLDPEASLHVLDLGLVEAIRGAAPNLALPLPSRSTAPEVLRQGPVGPRADVYSLGALLRMLTAGTSVPTAIVELIQHATAMHPDARPPTVSAFRTLLARALSRADEDADDSNTEFGSLVGPDASPPPIVVPAPSARPAMPREANPGHNAAVVDAPTLSVMPDTPERSRPRRYRGTSGTWVLLAATPFLLVIALGMALALAFGGGLSRPDAGTPADPGDTVMPKAAPAR